jgi:hypothetical protein
MKKYMTFLFGLGLVIWFSTAIYLSLNSIINIFYNTDPYMAKFILAGSFIMTVSIGVYNRYKVGDFTSLNPNAPKQSPRTGCRACKPKDGNVR